MDPSARLALVVLLFSLFASAQPGMAGESDAAEILKATGRAAGVCVHLGCREGKLLTEILRQSSFYAQGIVTDGKSVATARATIQAQGIDGRVSIIETPLQGLCYADNLINLVVVDDMKGQLDRGLTFTELFRITSPLGSVFIRDANPIQWQGLLKKAGYTDAAVVSGIGISASKPWPQKMDVWSHPRHGPDGNPVSQDRLIGPSIQYQWLATPLFGHGAPLGTTTAGGRFFAVVRDTPMNCGVKRHTLYARDAFNGRLLWKKRIQLGGGGRTKKLGFKGGSFVAGTDRLFAVLEPGGPLVAMDPADGKILTSYPEPTPNHVLYTGDVLLLTSTQRYPARGNGDLRALDPASGKQLWAYKANVFQGYASIWRSSPILVHEESVYFREVPKKTKPGDLIGLDLKSGKEKFRVSVDEMLSGLPKPEKGRVGNAKSVGQILLSCAYKGLIVLGGRGRIHAVSAETGKRRWSHQYRPANTADYTEVFGLKDMIWVNEALRPGHSSPCTWVGLDLVTGKPRKSYPTPHPKEKHFTERQCGQDAVTVNYFIPETKYGVKFVSTATGEYTVTSIGRNPCRFLSIPANGLVYDFPKDCKCYAGIRGILATSASPSLKGKPVPDEQRLVKGPAFGSKPTPRAGRADWPSFRRDASRSSFVETNVAEAPQLLWTAKIGGKLSSPVIAEGKVFAASVDRHRLFALEETTGKTAWTFTVGGRIDSPPTVHQGLCIIGCRDGYVYCLRADDGRLVWRFLAAPLDRRMGAYDQIESAWPVFGSVLIHNSTVFFSAGRHAKAEGGITVYAVNPENGSILWKKLCKRQVNNILQLGNEGRVLLNGGKESFDPRTGESRKKDGAFYTTGYKTFLVDQIGSRHGRGLGLKARSDKALVSVYGTRHYTKRGAKHIPGDGYLMFMRKKGAGPKAPPLWEKEKILLQIKALVLTQDKILVAGPPDVPIDKKAENPLASIEGGMGGRLTIMAPADGKAVGEVQLKSPPVYDGMAAANGRVFISLANGDLICLGKDAK